MDFVRRRQRAAGKSYVLSKALVGGRNRRRIKRESFNQVRQEPRVIVVHTANPTIYTNHDVLVFIILPTSRSVKWVAGWLGPCF